MTRSSREKHPVWSKRSLNRCIDEKLSPVIYYKTKTLTFVTLLLRKGHKHKLFDFEHYTSVVHPKQNITYKSCCVPHLDRERIQLSFPSYYFRRRRFIYGPSLRGRLTTVTSQLSLRLRPGLLFRSDEKIC